MSEHDTIIIGGGAAGLMAGVELARTGQRVVLLEARDRVGGRIFTRHHDVPLELGAEFIHGLPDATWSLVRQAALPTRELEGPPYRYQDGMVRPADGEPASAFDTLEQMGRWLGSLPAGTDLSFGQFLSATAISGSKAEQARRYVEGFNAADQHRISVRALDRQQHAEDAIDADRLFHLTQGYDTLPRLLTDQFVRAGGELRLKHPVQGVEWRRNAVKVHTTHIGTLSARHLIVALPLGVLKAGDVHFSPEVPALAGAMQGLEMGPVLRVSLLFRRAFWESTAPGMLFLFSPDQLIPTWWSAHPEAAPLLTGWIGGAAAMARIGTLRGEALVDAAVHQLSSMFGRDGGKLRSELLAGEVHDWIADPWSRGAYSYAAVGGIEASNQLARHVEQTLFFAGEHTDTAGHWGTVHAALASGRRAAQDLLSWA